MRAITACVAMTVLAGLTLTARGAEPEIVLTVRLYNSAGIPTSELVAARRAAGSILSDTGLGVVFRHCGPVDGCDEPLKPSEVVVRVINAPAFSTTLHPDAYGLAYVVSETNRGWLATVFADRIDRAAARVGFEPGTLLGRVIAHEVGHLLLGSHYHGEGGVMRADWPDALLTHAGEEWRFSTLEAARMHELPF
jgi:hypothetical protein